MRAEDAADGAAVTEESADAADDMTTIPALDEPLYRLLKTVMHKK